MKVSEEGHKKARRMVQSMVDDRRPWLSFWKDLAEYVLPRRYVELETGPERKATTLRNSSILDGTGTIALNTCASGLLNGITSPARPWFKLREQGDFENSVTQVWLDDCAARLAFALSESNFYNAFATLYVDLAGFGTSVLLIYEDDETIFRFYNLAVGEYALLQNERGVVDRISFSYVWRVEQVVNRFGLENCSRRVQEAWKARGARLNDTVKIVCLLEPNHEDEMRVAKIHKFRLLCWEDTAEPGDLLERTGFREWPAVASRWAILGNDSYGTSATADALGDIKQLQQMTKRKAQAMDKLVSPPIIADASLQHRPTAILPNGVTYVSNLANNPGARPLYQIQPPLGEMSADIAAIQGRIREFLFNDLFKMISQLDTVRSAREIDARVEEKLILLGPVLERFGNEALDVTLARCFAIMARKGLLTPPPEGQDSQIQIQYVSILHDAQRAVGAAPVERYVSFVGNLIGVAPEVGDIPNWTTLTLDYANRLGIPAKDNYTIEEIEERRQARQEQEQQAAMAESAPGMAQAAQTLSETEVGGGADALSLMLGG